MKDGGGGGERPFFCFRSNFRAITRLETLATQANGPTTFFTKLGERTREVLVAHVAAGRDHHVSAYWGLGGEMSASPRQWRPRRQNLTLPHVKGSKTALDSGINAVDSGFLVLDSSLRQWNLESRFQSFWDYRFLELYSGFQSPGFHRSTNINFQDFGIRTPLRGAIIGEPLTITLEYTSRANPRKALN